MIRAADVLLAAGAGDAAASVELAWLASRCVPGAADVRASHLRFKPGRSVIGRLTGAGGVPIGWVAGYGPSAADKAERLVRAGDAAGITVSVLQLGGGHVLLAAPVGLDKRLRRRLRQTSLVRADGSLRGQALAYNPFRRLVLRRAATGSGEGSAQGDVVLKLSQASVAHVVPLTTALRSAGVPVLVPRPVPGHEQHLLEFEHYGTGDLSTGASADDVAAAGDLLRRWHGAADQVASAVDLPQVQVRARLEAVVSGVAGLMPESAEVAREAARDLGMALERVAPEGGLVPVHGDFSADQLLRGANGLRVIDPDRAAWGSAGWDVGSFVAASLLADGAEPGIAAGAALLDGYGQASVAPAYVGAHIFLRALEPFRAAHAGWRGLVAERLRVAARCAAAPADAPLAALAEATAELRQPGWLS
ncbi:phosphotransferase family protein [Zhihengliuella flava]|uniref:Ser/Thr protein kinase RdoA (MazF antagonist) n=1 Tax=Zhihengliuella flava TaxID=1285193 RepID=A0A931D6H4_9MICC|nr:phosphotransferase [Zhihengliuella flava]MBG6085334.1 Ser/Thr protein kinase RdoA (MazF antagonist) [Zhihengliuella flava]